MVVAGGLSGENICALKEWGGRLSSALSRCFEGTQVDTTYAPAYDQARFRFVRGDSIMASENAHPRSFVGLGATARKDAWWVGPLLTALGFGAFIAYSTFRAIYNADYLVDTEMSAHILSPFYSPLILIPGLPAWFSPAFLILWIPGGFRVTCYYYRKAYYRSYFFDPPGCAVGEMRGTGYKGETSLFIFQNIHRYMMYLSVVIIFVLSYDVFLACRWPSGGGEGHQFGVSVATLVMTVNVYLLSCYTLGCHSLRHLVGGNLDCFSCSRSHQVRHTIWKRVSFLNKHHMVWAWVSLFWVGFTDFYVWMVASGHVTDMRIF